MLGWVSRPSADRWHNRVTRLMGGVGFMPVILVMGVCIYGLSFRVGGRSFLDASAYSQPLLVGASLLAGSLFLFFSGWLDDLWSLSPPSKLLLQIAAASQMIYLGGGFSLTGILPVDLAVSYLWMLGITNAVNLIDNMDGLCAGVCGLIFAALALALSDPQARLLAGVVSGACVGFLVFNWPKAKIFMGDTGSLPLGFLCAGLTLPNLLNGAWGSSQAGLKTSFFALAFAAVLVAIPILDTTLVTLTRLWRSQSPMSGGRDHTSHRLSRMLASDKRALFFFLTLTMATIAVFLYVLPRGTQLRWLAAGGVWVALIFLGAFLGREEVEAGVEEKDREASGLKKIVAIVSAYRLAPILLDFILIVGFFQAAYWIRFGFRLGSENQAAVAQAVPVLLFSGIGFGLLFGCYSSRWRFSGNLDFLRQAGAVFASIVVTVAFVTIATRFETGHARGAFLIYGILFLAVKLGLLKFFEVSEFLVGWAKDGGKERKPVLIYGAGKRGKLLAEACFQVPELMSYAPVAFFDDNEGLRGKILCGLRIQTPESSRNRGLPAVEEVWISTDSISGVNGDLPLPEAWKKAKVRRLKLELKEI